MATQKVNIDIQTKGAKKSKDELSGLTGAINKVGKAAGVASAAYFGAKGLIGAFSSVIEASAKQEQAETALEVALGRTSAALLNQASSLQQMTTAGDEAIIEQQAFLASLKFTEDQIKTIIPVALDLSAATGISLESAVRNTSKTFSGLAGELGELVPQLRELTQEEMKAGKAVEVLGNLFEGQAAKQSETLAGSLTQMSNAVGDAGEAIGSLLSPMVISTANAIKTLAEGVGSVITKIDEFGEEVNASIVTPSQKADKELSNFSESLEGKTMEQLEELAEQLQETGSKFHMTIAPIESANQNGTFQILGKGFEDVTDNADFLAKQLEEVRLAMVALNEESKPDRPIVKIPSAEENILPDLLIDMQEMNDIMDEAFTVNEKANKSFSLRNLIQKDNISTTKAFSFALSSASQINKEASHRNALFAKRAAQLEAIVNTASAVTEVLPNIPLSIAMGALGAIQIAKIESSKFAEGGIVPGTGNTDSVPAMLTPGEVILNAAQQQNLVGGMGNNITLNISAPLVDETVVESIIPAIQTALNEDRATLQV